MTLVDVLLPLPLEGKFTYILPPALAIDVRVGSRVIVPFGVKRHYTAIVTAIKEEDVDNLKKLKEIIAVHPDPAPAVTPDQLMLWTWIADYYLCTEGDVLRAALPAPLLHPALRKRPRSRRKADAQEEPTTPPPTLTPAQQQAADALREAWTRRPVALLHGVTSSGKTEIYIHLALEAIAQGRQVLYLVPEIALTTQLSDRLHRVFGERLGVYHSRCTDAQRADIWLRQLSDQPYDIILGVRSSVFLPFQRLGLVIVDEEHENTYKQQDPAPRYHARNVAVVAANHAHARVLLGTATPSLESYHNALTGK